jgi:hypothetical protein
MKAIERVHDPGQSLWLDTMTRGLLTQGALPHEITELSDRPPHILLLNPVWQCSSPEEI